MILKLHSGIKTISTDEKARERLKKELPPKGSAFYRYYSDPSKILHPIQNFVGRLIP